jgi:hypothetical protein
MAGEIPVFSITREAGADLSAAQYKGVVLDANGKVVVAGAGAKILGILQNDPVAGAAATVMVIGQSFAKISGAVTPGTGLVTAADGTFVNGDGVITESGALGLDSAAAGTVAGVLLK